MGVSSKEREWGGYKFLMISCAAWPHRELAAVTTDKSSCPNLPPAFCPLSRLFTHAGQQSCYLAPPAPSFHPSNKALRKTYMILPKSFKHRIVQVDPGDLSRSVSA